MATMATKIKQFNGTKGWYVEKQKQENMDIVKILVDAVIASGKKFNEIPKESIFSYLNKAGISKSKWDSIYNTLSMQFNETKTTVKVVEDKSFKPEVRNISTGDVKQRQPRKSIFSEIKKITP